MSKRGITINWERPTWDGTGRPNEAVSVTIERPAVKDEPMPPKSHRQARINRLRRVKGITV